MTYIVALDSAGAARCAKQAGLKGKWQAVTPDNYEHVIGRAAAPRQEFLWDFDGLPWGSWELPHPMLDALRACVNRAAT